MKKIIRVFPRRNGFKTFPIHRECYDNLEEIEH